MPLRRVVRMPLRRVVLKHHYVIKFVIELRQVGGYHPDTMVSSIKKTDHHDVTYIREKERPHSSY